MKKVFIDGQAGTTGLQLKNKLLNHPEVTLLEIESDKRKDIQERKKLMNESDVVFLCLPDEAAKEAVKLIDNPDTVVIDASTAHRTNEEWTYGFPELSAEHFNKIKNSKRIANPGCHATGFISIIYPLVSGGIMPKNYPVTAHSITGYSGGGNKMIGEYENENREYFYKSPRQYGLSQNHKHLPEMVKVTGLEVNPVFNPIVADYYCGMAVSVPIFTDLLKVKMSVYDLKRYFIEFYKNSKFITVHSGPESGFLPATGLEGTNNLRIYICGNDERVTITAVFDNLGKGASSAAIENMNIAMGFDEAAGL
ncbi:MAG: N-acetyl-gamma-glutamyl-phosphate reductase [Acutalibacteraceae bacterium]|nr:N-acetyl-gamma-glutamyl-phosphate reductase [Acutalibacteraceae bacterium]